MKALSTVMALVEAGAGVALFFDPSLVVKLLLGSPLQEPAAVVLGRVAGLALVSLGIACWRLRHEVTPSGANGVVRAMLFYNGSVALLFVVTGLGSELTGIALWPAAILHAALAGWCVRGLMRPR